MEKKKRSLGNGYGHSYQTGAVLDLVMNEPSFIVLD